MDNHIQEISRAMVDRYSDRYRKLGRDIRTLGWGSRDQQFHRFSQILDGLPDADSFLDIGCGFGDFLSVLLQSRVPFKAYTGWDINPDLIAEARSQWTDKKGDISFDVKNISEGPIGQPLADVAIMIGLLNLNFSDRLNNYDYALTLIQNALSCVRKCLVVDFISEFRAENYPAEDFIFYYNPGEVLNRCLGLTPNVMLKHDYAPIPQKEFMLFLYK